MPIGNYSEAKVALFHVAAVFLMSGGMNIKEDYEGKFPMPEQGPRTKRYIPPHPDEGIVVRIAMLL